MKRGFSLLLVLSITIALSGGIYALSFSVDPLSNNACPDGKTKILGFSDSANAHGELAGQNNYEYGLCTDFPGDLTCTEDNKIIGLSDSTNAHGEVPELTNYGNPVCYDSVRCINVTGSGSVGDYDLPVLSLSGYTNAHLANASHYNTKIYCLVEGTPYAQWIGKQGQQIDKLVFEPGTTSVGLVFKNSGLSQGTTVMFDIYEKGLFDDEINSLSAEVDENGKASTSWIIPASLSDGDVIYFEVDGVGSEDLELIEFSGEEITACGDYTDEQSCTDDPAEIAVEELSSSGVDCSDELTDCTCSFNSTSGTCSAVETTFTLEDGIKTPAEDCSYDIIEDDPFGCEDDGVITRVVVNSCDPDNEIPQEIVCPASVELPFFGFYNLLISVFVIALIYYFMFVSRSKKR